MNVNKVTYGGRLTRDPELRFTPSNVAVANFSVATNRRIKDASGQWKDAPPTFVEITAWGKTGEAIAKHFNKGDEILLFGRLELEEWTDRQTNQKRQKLKMVAEEFQFVGSKQERQPSHAASSAGYGGGGGKGHDPLTDDEIPFAPFDWPI